ncbi:hypothetical protein C8046_12600 [Serinibacter arcticus]|uniref:HdeD family acid-resistance protein n=1 Tax=Serinibacter arcticus TaxID=1655435 RepID=A0A2U1ZWK7_9MICO|nr:DUF308 domain-containing protein [Serinibacter arcticus]PWD51376.1 hypothetical protein C8046_12600 [Serinibacter arcticus]
MTSPTQSSQPTPSPSSGSSAFPPALAEASARALRILRIALGLAGVVTLLVGALILIWPGRTAVVGTAILAVYLIVVGLLYLAAAIFSQHRGAWARIGHLVLAALFVAGGISAFSNLQATTAVLAVFLAVLIGVLWIVEGIVSLATVSRSENRVWTVVFAVISVLAGISLVTSPLWSAVLLWWLVGISLVVIGALQVARAITFGRPA